MGRDLGAHRRYAGLGSNGGGRALSGGETGAGEVMAAQRGRGGGQRSGGEVDSAKSWQEIKGRR